MAIKYLIKDVLVATEKNPNFAGQTRTYWIGKESTTEDENDIVRVAKWYGYSTKAGATRGLKKQRDLANWETERGFWKHTSVEIVAVNVPDNA